MKRDFSAKLFLLMSLALLLIGNVNASNVNANLSAKKNTKAGKSNSAITFRYRKYDHVKKFIKPLAKKTIELAKKYIMPPAAILAIASVESGYGRGYVASISGNILSLGTNKGEKELPPLYLPNIKQPFKIIYNPNEIAKFKKTELNYKTRAKSLKKDYRPAPYSGTANMLEYFDENVGQKINANLANFEDFSRVWISEKNSYEPFKKARKDLNSLVSIDGIDALFTKTASLGLINNIGGKPNSFNYRKTWPKKVVAVMKNIGLIKLMKDIESGKSFEEAWRQ